MNPNQYWNPNMGRNRGGYNRGGRGFNRGWPRNRGGFSGPNFNFDGYRGGYRYQNPNNQGDFWKSRPKREKRDTPGKRLTEDLIGVTEYISEHEGFNGIIKSRYSDFQVSEMNEKGEFAKLTDTQPPPRPTDPAVDEDEDLLISKYNLEILPMETWDKINSLTVNKEKKPGDDETVEIDMEGVSKEQRTKIHDAVKKAFGESIVGSTVNVGDKKFMRFQKYRKGVRIDNRVKWVWPGEYVYFVVHKQNCDTMDAAVRIADRLGMQVKPSTLGYAGTKDRRAKTSQWFSVKRTDPSRIASACKQLKDIHVGNYSFGDCNLKLGMLKGNKFRIALRNVTAKEQSIDDACKNLKEMGFINYYGLQRFGSRIDTPTYDIGLKMLQGNYREAINAILEPREGPLERALHVYKCSGAVAAAEHVPWRVNPAVHSEARLIKALAAQPNDLVGALGRLARNIRLLYLHSYQSLVWNKAVSERIRRFGLKPAVGDCVPLSNIKLEGALSDESDSEDEENMENEETDAKKSKSKRQDTPKPAVPLKILTQEDIDSGEYNVFNIVMPLPGAFVEYPPNMKDFYEEILTKDGLKMDMKQKVKSYNMSGAYRHMVVRPLGVEWRHVRYTDPFADLVASDLDELENREITGIVEDGTYRALLLTMVLPSSCYATMALRELLKVDTSSDNQALQNNYHKRKAEKDKANESGEKMDEEKMDEEKMDEEKMDEEKSTKEEKETIDSKVPDNVGDLDVELGEKRKLEENLEENGKKAKIE